MDLDIGFKDVPPCHVAAVVTTLEMRRPVPSRVAAAQRFERHEAMPLDRYRDLFRRVGQEWLWFSRLALSDTTLAAIVHDPQVELWTLMQGDRAEGLLELDFRIAGSCELAFFGVTGALVATGAGRAMMNHAIARAWARPITRLWVHTCTLDHPAALAFYLRSGFTAVGRQIEIAADPRLTGVLPRDAAPGVPIVEAG